jgi:sugar (pentulose or hexulose) kinase
VRAAVVDVDGQLLGRAARPLETVVSAPGRAEHDPRAWRAAALETGSEAVVQAGEIEVVAVGIGALGPAPVLVDAQLQPLDDAERKRPAVIERLFEATGLAEAGAPGSMRTRTSSLAPARRAACSPSSPMPARSPPSPSGAQPDLKQS